MRELGRWVLVVSALGGAALIGCESAPVTPQNDAGLDGGTNMTTPDSGPTVDVCDRDSVCRDELFCNGEERCAPGERGADERGCIAGMPPCAETERCIEAEDRCELDDCADGGDADGDGDRRPGCGGRDCNDDDGRVYITAQETCDAAGLDEDCNPETIHNARTNDGDVDADGFIDVRCFNRRRDGTENGGTDCNDMRPTVNPSGVESCNLIDDDCDSMVDEGVQVTFYRDEDGDNYGVAFMTTAGCVLPAGYAAAAGDCADMNPARHPASPEQCDGVDNNCDGVDDAETCDCVNGVSEVCGPETELGRCEFGGRVCVEGRWSVCTGAVMPQSEVCNGADDDCDGLVDEAVSIACYRDSDRDGYAAAGAELIWSCGGCREGFVDRAPLFDPREIDCDDAARTVYPGAPEVCNRVDDNCNGRVDEFSAELGSRQHCSACFDSCQFACSREDTRDGPGVCDPAVEVVSRGTVCARTEGRRLFCWGDNSFGAVGDGTRLLRDRPVRIMPSGATVPNVVDFDTNGRTTCAIDGRAYCWGANDSGQLGNGSLVDSPAPVRVTGDRAESSSFWRQISVSDDQTVCAVNTALPAEVYCWGRSVHYRSITGSWFVRSSTSASPMSNVPRPAVLDLNYSSCLITSSGSAECWGYPSAAGRGDPPFPSDRFVDIAAVSSLGPAADLQVGGHELACARLVNGQVWCWGRTPSQVTGLPPVDDLHVGSFAACARTSAGEVYCWGENAAYPDGTSRTFPGVPPGTYASAVRVPALDRFDSISLGTRDGCGIEAGVVYCWGGAIGTGFVRGIAEVLPPL